MNDGQTPSGPYPGGIDPALYRGLTQRRMSRRELFRYAGAGAGAISLSAFLAACGVSGSGGSNNGSQSGSLQSQIKKIYGDEKPAGTLNFANWEAYIDVDSKGKSPTLEDFTKATDIKVNYSTPVNDNAPFIAKIIPVLQNGQDTGYDLIVVTNGGGIEPLLKLDFLLPLDHKLIPNYDKYASPAVKNPAYDPGNVHSVAWQSGMTAIGYNKKYIKEPPRSFGDLLNPKYKGKVGMFANDADLPAPALVYLGYDVQTSTPKEWQKAADLLKKQRDDGIVRSYYDQSYLDALENEDIIISQAWSGDIFIAKAPKSVGGDGYPTLDLALPQEGAILWTDNMCIPKYAQHPVDACLFMNFVYQPKIAAQLADFIWYISPVPDAKDVVLHQIKDPAVANSPLVFPSAQDLSKTQGYKAFKDQAEQDEWDSIFQPIYSS